MTDKMKRCMDVVGRRLMIGLSVVLKKRALSASKTEARLLCKQNHNFSGLGV